jgi:hypothetical protein
LSVSIRRVACGGFHSPLCHLEIVLFLRKLIRVLRLSQGHGSIIHVFRRDCALLVKFRAALVKLLRRIQGLFGEFQILLALLQLHLIGNFGLRIAPRALLGGAGQILVLQLAQQLVRLHVAALVHIPFLYGGDDFRDNGRLIARVQDRIRHHLALDRLFFCCVHLDGHGGLCFGRFLLAASRENGARGRQNKCQADRFDRFWYEVTSALRPRRVVCRVRVHPRKVH